MAIQDFSLRTADMSRGTGQLLQGIGGLKHRMDQQKQQEANREMMGELSSAIQRGDSDEVFSMISQNPQFADYAKKLGGIQNEAQQQEKLVTAYEMLRDDPIAAIDRSILRIEQRGGDAAQTRQMRDAIAQDPARAKKMAMAAFAMYGSPDQYKQVKDVFGVEQAAAAPEYTSVVTGEGGQRFGINKATGKYERIAAPEGFAVEGGQPVSLSAGVKDFEYYQELKKTDPDSAKEFGMERGYIRPDGKPLSIHLQKRLSTSGDEATKAASNSREYAALAQDIERSEIKGGLFGGKWGETFKSLTGSQDAVTNLKKKYNAIRASQAVSNLPPKTRA